MPLEDVCAGDKGWFGWPWDAWVAIGTIFLALVTTVAVIWPIVAENRRRTERAWRYAVLLDHELVMLYGGMIRRAKELEPARENKEDIEDAMNEYFGTYALFSLPLVEKFVDQLEVFPPIAGAKLGLVLSSVLTARRNKPEPAPVPYEMALEMLKTAVNESIVLAVRAREAIDELRKLTKQHATLSSLSPLPVWVREKYDALAARRAGRDLI